MNSLAYIRGLIEAMQQLKAFTELELIAFLQGIGIEIENKATIDEILDSNLVYRTFDRYYVRY